MDSVEQAPPFARRFFMAVLPQHVSSNVEKFAALAGSIAFYVRGQGKWTVRLGDLESPVVEGMAEDADLSLWFAADAFAGFVDGKLDAAQAIAKDQVRFDGDVNLLEKFGFLLAASSNAVSARFNR